MPPRALVGFTRVVAHIVERAHARDSLPLGVRSHGAPTLLVRGRHEPQPVLVIAAKVLEEVKLAVGGSLAVEDGAGAIALQVILATLNATLRGGSLLGAISGEAFSANVYRFVSPGAVAASWRIKRYALKRVFLPRGWLEAKLGTVAFRERFQTFLG